MLPLIADFRLILTTLQGIIAPAAVRDRARTAMLCFAWSYLHRTMNRFESLYARFLAGTPRRAPATRPEDAPKRVPTPRLPSLRLPRVRFWLVRTLGYNAANIGSQLTHFLARPDCAAFLAAEPRAARLLRPLMAQLWRDPLPSLALPPRPPRQKLPRRQPPPPPAPERNGKYLPHQIRRYRPGRIPAFPKKPA